MSTPSDANEGSARDTEPEGEATLAATRDQVGPKPSPELARGTEIGRYLVVQEIGRGATGRVWAAYDGDLDRRVAIKLVAEPIADDPERRKRLLGEAQAMARIRHPNVVLVHDVGTHEGRLYIAMEFVEGTTLGRWCSAAPRTVVEILDAFDGAARGLAAAHGVGIVHRDFKPDNVLVDHDGRARVVDFGLARADEDPKSPAAARPPRPAGTPAYMSPEHYGHGVIDARSDQFSFCVALCEALSGRRPFRGETLAELAVATLGGDRDDAVMARLPPRIRRVIARGLAADPAARHPSMEQLIAALDRARRPRWPLAVALVASATAGVLLWVLRPPVEAKLCRGDDEVASVWNDAVRRTLELSPGELSPSYADTVAQRLATSLDDYAAAWVQLHDEVCRGARSDDPLAAGRTACVDDRFAAFQGLVALTTHGRPAAERVDALLDTLPALDDCRRDDAASWEPVPPDPELAARVEAVRALLRDARLRYKAGELHGVDDALLGMVADARATGYPHVVAQALTLLAQAEDLAGDPHSATQHLDDALALALAGGHDRLAATIAIVRIGLAAQNPSYDVQTEHWGSLARALIERSGGDDHTLADLESAVGSVLGNRGEFGLALAQYELALAAYERAHGPDHHLTAGAQLGCAEMMVRLGRTDEAWQRVLGAQQTIEDELGRQHPEALRAMHSLGVLELAREHSDIAIEIMQDSLQRAELTFGPRSRQVSTIAFNLSMPLAARGRVDEARTALQRSREAWPVSDDRLSDAQLEDVETRIAHMSEDVEGALVHVDRAFALYPRDGNQFERALAKNRLMRAGLLIERARWREALDTIEQAYPRWRDTTVFSTAEMLDAIAAGIALDDRIAIITWLARLEATTAHGQVDRELRIAARAIAGNDRSGPALAAVGNARAKVAELRFPRHPRARQLAGWLAGEWPIAQLTSSPRRTAAPAAR